MIELPANCGGALLFMESDCLFIWPDGHSVESKYLRAGDIKNALSLYDYDTGWIPDNMLRYGYKNGEHWFLYRIPARRTKFWLVHPETNQTIKLDIPLPGMILHGKGDTYRFYAIKSYRSFESCKVYNPPFPNLTADHICWGANKPPEARPENVERVLKLFFDSPFTGHSAEKKSVRFQTDVRQMLLFVERKGYQKYPSNDLIPMGMLRDQVKL